MLTAIRRLADGHDARLIYSRPSAYRVNIMIRADIAIIGGGIAGLWLLNCLKARGYRTLLFERDGLGAGQTLASQGMIHGGVKYNLDGLVSHASATIASMPELWRHCLNGEPGNDSTYPLPDLRDVRCLADRYYLFSDSSLTGRLTSYLSSLALRGTTTQLAPDAFPEPFSHVSFGGSVYELPDVVIDSSTLLTELARNHQSDVLQAAPTPIPRNQPGIEALALADGTRVEASCYIFSAGTGNAGLLAAGNLDVPMQTRPLHQVLVKGGHLPALYAHAVGLGSGDRPRVTITSHRTEDGGTVWYLGGDMAETGVSRTDGEQIRFAQREMATIFPFIDFDTCQWETLRVDRAEPRNRNRLRPDQPFSKRLGNVVVCWPIKLTLVPMLANEVLTMISEPPADGLGSVTPELPLAPLAAAPWDTAF